MKELITLSSREVQRMQVLEQIKKGVLSLKAAAPLMKVCCRQAKRLWARYQRDGLRGLVHQHRGRPARNALGSEVRERVPVLHGRFIASSTTPTSLRCWRSGSVFGSAGRRSVAGCAWLGFGPNADVDRSIPSSVGFPLFFGGVRPFRSQSGRWTPAMAPCRDGLTRDEALAIAPESNMIAIFRWLKGEPG